MKSWVYALSLVMLACGHQAPAVERSAQAAENAVTLPPPRTDGTVAVEKALKERRSLRTPAETPLTVPDVGQLCWAAQGVTDDRGHRTAPSALATYPLELYVIAGNVTGLAAGFYHYEPAKHALRLVAAGDKRAEFETKAIGQGWAAKAPAIFVVSGSAAKMTKMRERAAQFMYTEVGLAAQGFFLEATALGLGSTFVGGFKPAEARAVLGLAAGEDVLAVLPVGHKP
jgi:SagB-type dehydrogenase family enzyme